MKGMGRCCFQEEDGIRFFFQAEDGIRDSDM